MTCTSDWKRLLEPLAAAWGYEERLDAVPLGARRRHIRVRAPLRPERLRLLRAVDYYYFAAY